MTGRQQQSVSKAAKKAAARPGPRADKADGEAAVLAKIAAMPPYCAISERLHPFLLRGAPALQPTLYYGTPRYTKDGQRVCCFRADKYMMFGLSEAANAIVRRAAR